MIGARETGDRVAYWLKGEGVQNFGDALSDWLLHEFLTVPIVEHDRYHLIGSVICDSIVEQDINATSSEGSFAFWCCGARDVVPLSDGLKAKCEFYGVRGPLTRKALDLPAETPLGDPGFLLSIVRQSTRSPSSRSLCVPHFLDTTAEDDLLRKAGSDDIVWPKVSSKEDIDALIERIASAEFVLAGALHAAVVAAALGVPFAFWDTSHFDVPFKWRDLAALLAIPNISVSNVEDGRKAYYTFLEGRIKRPALYPMLEVCPFGVRPQLLRKAILHDEELTYSRNLRVMTDECAALREELISVQKDAMRGRIPELGGKEEYMLDKVESISANSLDLIKRAHEIETTSHAIAHRLGAIEATLASINANTEDLKSVVSNVDVRLLSDLAVRLDRIVYGDGLQIPQHVQRQIATEVMFERTRWGIGYKLGRFFRRSPPRSDR